MKRILAIAIATSISGFLTTANGQDQVKLPESETTAVFTMEFLNRPESRLPRLDGTALKPYLQVFANGRVVSPRRFPSRKVNELQLTPEQLQTFLKQVVKENQFYELNTEKIKEDIAAAGLGAIMTDTPNLKISMELPRGAHAIQVCKPKSSAKKPLKVKSMLQFAKIKGAARKLALATDAGGFGEIEPALLKVNEQLKEKGFDPMTSDEIYFCGHKAGTLRIHFNRKYFDENGRVINWVDVTFTDNGDEEAVEIRTKKDKREGEKKLKPNAKAFD